MLSKKIVKQVLKPFFKLTANRERGLKAETTFWDTWFKTKGEDYPDDFNTRTNPNAPIVGRYKEWVDKIDGDVVSILDVGAGPLTVCGKKHPTKTVHLTAVDPLADEYDKLIAKYGVTPPVHTERLEGEKLLERFKPASFDMVMAQNCLDHGVDPFLSLMNMVEVCRVGGIVCSFHAENEAEYESYRGLHQWNFSLKDEKLIITGRTSEKNVDKETSGRVRWEHRREGRAINSCGRKIS